MPELPEVETIRRDLERQVVGAVVRGVWSEHDPHRYVRLRCLCGQRITGLTRRGKYLVLQASAGDCVLHLGMSGRLFLASERPSVPHMRALAELSRNRWLAFVDRRRFGVMKVVPTGDYRAFPGLMSMGPEPLSCDFDLGAFCADMAARRGACKQALLSQSVVAGLGNIYVDEALHRAGIHPGACRLSATQATKLHGAIRQVLQEAISRRGTTFSLYRDGLMNEGDFYAHLRVFDRAGQPCRSCRTPIAKIQQGGRGTHFCPRCQPAPEPHRP